MPKSPRNADTVSIIYGELSTKERRNHGGGVLTDVITRDLRENAHIIRHKARFASVLDRYYAHGRINEAEHSAGIRFQHAYARAVLRIRVTDVGSGGPRDPEMAAIIVIKSEELLRHAYSVLSDKQKAVIISVCGHDEFAGHPNRMETLKRGLKKLTELWE